MSISSESQNRADLPPRRAGANAGNLTVRTFLKRFTRLSLGFSKKLENLLAAVSLYVAHYNFCRWHGSFKMTPAMKARITGHPWTMEELLTEAESE